MGTVAPGSKLAGGTHPSAINAKSFFLLIYFLVRCLRESTGKYLLASSACWLKYGGVFFTTQSVALFGYLNVC